MQRRGARARGGVVRGRYHATRRGYRARAGRRAALPPRRRRAGGRGHRQSRRCDVAGRYRARTRGIPRRPGARPGPVHARTDRVGDRCDLRGLPRLHRVAGLPPLRRPVLHERPRTPGAGVDARAPSPRGPTADQQPGRHFKLRHARNRPAAARLRHRPSRRPAAHRPRRASGRIHPHARRRGSRARCARARHR